MHKSFGLEFLVVLLAVSCLALLIWSATEPNREQERCQADGGIVANVSGALLLVESGGYTAEAMSNDMACVFSKEPASSL